MERGEVWKEERSRKTKGRWKEKRGKNAVGMRRGVERGGSRKKKEGGKRKKERMLMTRGEA